MACVRSSDPTLRAMWPDGQQDITEVTKRPLTAGTLFKNSMVALVENLACKVLPLPPPWIFPGPPICAPPGVAVLQEDPPLPAPTQGQAGGRLVQPRCRARHLLGW